MNINNLLNQVLGAGQQLNQRSNGNVTGQGLGGLLQSVLGNSNSGSNSLIDTLGGLMKDKNALKKLGGSAAAAGILSMVLGGSNGSRGMSNSIAKMGSLAAIGTLAYKAYQSWQQNDAKANANTQSIQPSAQRSQSEAENNSRVVLKAMIAAAKADGEISAAEQNAILNQVGQEDQEAQNWLNQILQNIPTPQQIAAEVGNDSALAAEVYLASRIVCGDLDRKEIIFLANLQQALGLEDNFVEQLEKQAGF
ncbi:tellurite resistance TerB family protein [Suttonella ornithocola]|uniref:Protein of uncharacterized function (DUF533) n=1 Tax=Suttonella ornithocola TaxID=279832 RepID=A0A380MTI4_9GAMM|nr:tellurite resistance TerB family protein [Suttonella ornithocola]SUO95376.1 Protein of uncharacterised function (DUF533) [Suttonella ornithocola]